MDADDAVSAGRRSPVGALPKSFLHPCLLLLLKEQPGYGYDLVARLAKLGIDDDSAAVYRALRALEQQQAVSSYWHRSSTGPARHMYRLTPVGDEQLHTAVEAAAEMHRAIQRYFGRYAATESRPPEAADGASPSVSPAALA